jgi:SpoVK/Ycf46/Vps4 family AAA+-type ATPase
MCVGLWQRQTFGAVDFCAQARKLQREANELEYASGEELLAELADCRIVLMAIEALAGFSEADLRAAVERKHLKNLSRTWRQLDDGTWQHVPQDAERTDSERQRLRR